MLPRANTALNPSTAWTVNAARLRGVTTWRTRFLSSRMLASPVTAPQAYLYVRCDMKPLASARYGAKNTVTPVCEEYEPVRTVLHP